ncbi:DUF7096 domain-containing protein [Natrialbaceae archaeon A-gly3]
MKLAAPALTILLVLALPAMTVVAAGPPATTLEAAETSGELTETGETTNRLTLDGEIRSGYAGSGPDIAATLMTHDDVLRADHALFLVQSDFEGSTDAEREELIALAVERTNDRIDALEQREREAVRAHANGDLSDQQLLSVLVRNYNTAAELSTVLSELEGYANQVSGYDSGGIADADATLEVFRSEIRGDFDTAMRGEAMTEHDFVLETTEHGYSLAMIDGGTYLRETTRFDNRDRTGEDRIAGIDNAIDRFEEELYPWAFDNRIHSTAFSEAPTAQLYSTHTSTPQGDLTAYLDGATREVYHEVQSLTIDDLPPQPSGTWTDDSLELAVNETPVSGPMELRVTDADSGEPVDATITADGYEFDETGDDGTLWLIPPAGEFEVIVEADERTLEATVAGS